MNLPLKEFELLELLLTNPNHLPPSSPAKIGQSDQANHQYDLNDSGSPHPSVGG